MRNINLSVPKGQGMPDSLFTPKKKTKKGKKRQR